jgi:hypothetical protein
MFYSSPDSIVTRLRDGWSMIHDKGRDLDFLFITTSRTVLQPAQPPTGAEGKAAGRETTTHQQHSL